MLPTWADWLIPVVLPFIVLAAVWFAEDDNPGGGVEHYHDDPDSEDEPGVLAAA